MPDEPASARFERRFERSALENGRAVSDERGVAITLSPAQVAEVVRQASDGAGRTAAMLAGLGDARELKAAMSPLLGDATYSQSTLRAALTLAAFPIDGSERALTDVARELGLLPSITHRYVITWEALGLLERDPRSRRYSRPCPPVRAPKARER